MDAGDLAKLILLALAVLFSAFFSSTEAAFLSIQQGKLAHLVKSGVKGADQVARVAGRPERLLPTVLAGNNLVNTAAAALGTSLAASFLSPNAAVIAATAGVTILLMVFGEIIPKTLGARNSERLAVLLVGPLQVAEWLLFPAVWVLQRLSRITSRVFGLPEQAMVTEEEIRSLIDMGREAGAVHPSEADMLEQVFHFGDRPVREVMTPRTEVVWLSKDTTLEQFLQIYSENQYTRFPVYEDTVDNVVGLVSLKDVVRSMAAKELGPQDTLAPLLRPAYFVPESKPAAELFSEMRSKGYQMAIVVDEFGGVAGLVTLKALLEVIVGPVGEEGAPAEEDYQAIDEFTYELDGGMGIDEINEKLGLNLPEGDYQTVAGFVLDQMGRVPTEGEHFHYQNLRLTIKEMKGVKIEKVEVRVSDHQTSEPVS